MNCHKNNDTNRGNNTNPMKHMIHMILCCGLPFFIIFALPFVARYSPKVAGLLGVIAPFICPIMMGSMVFIMFFSNRKKNSDCYKDKKEMQ